MKLATKLISTGEEGPISDGSFLRLPASLDYADGSIYSGLVSVRSLFLDAENEDVIATTLGNMQVLNKQGEYKMVGSLGMLRISLFDTSGDQLFIPSDQVASVKIPILSKHFPHVSNMKSWILDEDSAIWRESGTVSKEGEMLVAEIDEASCVNFGVSYSFFQMSMSFRDMNNREVPNLKVRLSADDAIFNEVIINTDNVHEMSLPLDEDLFIHYVYDDIEYSQSIGIYDGLQTNREVILEDLSAYVVTGRAVNCNVQNVQSGYGILTEAGRKSTFNIEDGQINYVNNLQEHSVDFFDRISGQIVRLDIGREEDDIFLTDVGICEEGVAHISGYVILDMDENGTGDTPLANQIINLTGDGVSLQQATNTDGYYQFSFAQTDSVYLQFAIDQNKYVIFQSGDESPESADELLSYGDGFAIRNLSVFDDEDNNFILINQGNGRISGRYLGDVDGDGVGDVPLEWQVLNTATEDQIGYVDTDGEYSIARPNGHGELWTDFYDWISDFDNTPDPDGDDSVEGANGRIPYFINSDEVDADNDFVIALDFCAIAIQVLEDVDGDGTGDIPVAEGTLNIKHLTGGPATVSTSYDLSEGRYMIDEFAIGFAELHEATLVLPFDYELVSIVDFTPDNDPSPVGDTMNVRTIGAEWDGGNTFIIRRL